jgi:DNA repair exonuclease SbcCD nuclease subunit
MKLLLSGDWHFKLSDPYKFKLFDVLISLKSQYDQLIFLGDLTDDKNRHDSYLVNKICTGFTDLRDAEIPVLMIYGNHDFIDSDQPFFQFLKLLPNIEYISKATTQIIEGKKLRFVPWTKDEADFEPADYCFTHLTLNRCVSEGGFTLESNWNESFFSSRYKKTFSGDIHKPQTIGSFTYVGAPYHNRFGDNYDGQLIILDTATGKTEIISLKDHFPKKLKVTLSGLGQVRDIDQVRVQLKITEKNKDTWSVTKRELEEKGYQVEPIVEINAPTREDILIADIQPENVLSQFCETKGLPNIYKDIGKTLLGNNK